MRDSYRLAFASLFALGAFLAHADTLALFDGAYQRDLGKELVMPRTSVAAPHLSISATKEMFGSQDRYNWFGALQLGGAIAADYYFGFRIAPDPGYTFDIESFGFDVGISYEKDMLGSPYRIAQVYALTSVGGFTSSSPTIGAGTAIDLTDDRKLAWTAVFNPSVDESVYRGLKEPLEIRLYLTAGPGTGNAPPEVHLDNIRVQGKVRPVPEPAPLLALAGGTLALLRRRAQKSPRARTSE